MANSPTNLCRDFANTLKGTIMSSDNNSCVVIRTRNIDATLQGRTVTSPLALAAMFSYEGVDDQGRALNLGETVILQREVNAFIDALRDNNITVTALHNHWMFDRPRLMFIHFQAISTPLAFAQGVADAFDTFTNRSENEE